MLGGYPCGDTSDTSDIDMGYCYYFFGYPYGDTCFLGIPAEIHRIHRILPWGNATIVVILTEIHAWWVSLRRYIGYIGY
jgi:hypothetical protein